ncbi:MAG TPA: VanZ family protein, partial [Mobilitalea sp.]|nr:VanZ family protein [Mobilitalea sp.]
ARLARLCALLLLPFFIEAMQFVFLRAYCDIDDLIYAFIGGLIGSLLYYLINVIFRAITGKDFLMKETSYRFSNSNLHF